MAFLKFLAAVFLFPGTALLSSINVNIEEDGGILRSFVNMMFWGLIAIMISLPFVFG